MRSPIRDDGNGAYVINKKTGISVALVIMLIGAVGFYFQGQYSLEARVNAKIESGQKEMHSSLHKSIDEKVNKEDYREDMKYIRDQLERINGKIDRMLGHR